MITQGSHRLSQALTGEARARVHSGAVSPLAPQHQYRAIHDNMPGMYGIGRRCKGQSAGGDTAGRGLQALSRYPHAPSRTVSCSSASSSSSREPHSRSRVAPPPSSGGTLARTPAPSAHHQT